MALIRATVKLNMKSGVEKDSAINVWHFENGDTSLTGPQATQLQTHFGAFYSALGVMLAHSVSRVANAHEITFAEVSAGGAGVDDDVVSRVLWLRTFTVVGAASGTQSFPSEVAVALSFRGDITDFAEESGSTRPAARKRGRSFLGPWGTVVGETNASTGVVTLAPVYADAILDAYVSFIASINGMSEGIHNHVVYSPKNGSSSKIVQAHVDMAFDTVRSRGVESLSRDTRPITQSEIV